MTQPIKNLQKQIGTPPLKFDLRRSQVRAANQQRSIFKRPEVQTTGEEKVSKCNDGTTGIDKYDEKGRSVEHTRLDKDGNVMSVATTSYEEGRTYIEYYKDGKTYIENYKYGNIFDQGVYSNVERLNNYPNN